MFEDELLHSYIARKQIMYRHKNVRNIITYPGGWRATPYIPSEIAKKIGIKVKGEYVLKVR